MPYLLVVMLVAAGLPVHAADTRRFYDRDGHPAGRAETDGRTTRFYDARGLPAGRAQVDERGTVRTYDSRGLPAGQVRR